MSRPCGAIGASTHQPCQNMVVDDSDHCAAGHLCTAPRRNAAVSAAVPAGGAAFDLEDLMPGASEPHQESIGWRNYTVEQQTSEAGEIRSTLRDPIDGGGWNLVYDPDTKTAMASGRHPAQPSSEWLDRGEADARELVRRLHPDATHVVIRDQWYPIAVSDADAA